jgi:acetyltransferase-like isoleucine patch superfamily enzyme
MLGIAKIRTQSPGIETRIILCNCYTAMNIHALKSLLYSRVKTLFWWSKPIIYDISGQNNRLLIIRDGVEYELAPDSPLPGLKIEIHGNNNVVRIEQPTKFVNSNISINSNNSEFHIGPSPQLHLNVSCWGGNNQKLVWGKGSDTSWEVRVYLCGEGSSVIIGEDAMFAGEITIWSAESHVIFNRHTRAILNEFRRPLEIGSHSWIGQGVCITKNAYIASNTIVGTKAVVASTFEQEYTAIAGNPARVIKTGVAWDRRNIADWRRAEMP